MAAVVALVGRPNAGKSTLFNRLIGKKVALVHEQPGMTRDYREGEAYIDDFPYLLLDTPGLKDDTGSALAPEMEEQMEKGVEKANIILFLVDAQDGITSADEEVNIWLRKKNKPVILVVNKTERRKTHPEDFYAWGYDPTLFISAKEGLGIVDIKEALLPYIEKFSSKADGEKGQRAAFNLAIVGRPNVGKSTILNGLLKEDRLITSETEGSTRDAITIPLTWQGEKINLIDTAGIRRKYSTKRAMEQTAVDDAKRAIQYAQIAALTLDAQYPLEHQDLTIANFIINEGRGFFIIVNKIDLIKDKAAFKQEIEYKLSRSLAQIKEIKVVYLSARTQKDLNQVLTTAQTIYDLWNKRVPTSRLNRWLEEVVAQHPPPLVGGRHIKLRYITQANTRPPTFALFINKPEELPGSYVKYLENSLRKSLDLGSVPLRLHLRKGKNPYTTK